MYLSRYKFKTVAQAAAGHWGYIASCIAPQLEQAIAKAGRHVPCPVNGGKDGFRVFKDFDETGGGSSNKDGQFANGFKLLCWVTGDNPDSREAFSRMVDRVGDIICPTETIKPHKSEPGDVVERVGVLKSFGYAEHRFDDPTQPPAFCVVLETPLGERKFFTSKLKKAIQERGLQQGDSVCVRSTNVTKPGDQYKRFEWEIERATRPAPRYHRKTILEAQDEALAPAELSESAEKIWHQSVTLNFADPAQQAAHRYLTKRGITVTSKALNEMDAVRFHPNLAYFDVDSQKVIGYFPALIFAVRRHDGEMVNCHRIYLSKDGSKAPVPQPKKMTMVAEGVSVSGAAIPLLKPKHGLVAVAEGPETALAVATAMQVPVWSTVSATMMENFVPPKDVKCVLIFADSDASKTGQKAALTLRQRLLESGLVVRVYLPYKGQIPSGKKGVDWNDVLLKDGPSGFPKFLYG